jgi:putative tryptophan/tyrosine transport system substrate-binding protein
MRRRVFIAVLGAAALARSAAAQNARKVYRLGVLAQSSRWMEEVGRTLIVPELARQGFVEGNNLVIDFLGGPDEDLPRLAGEIVDRAPDAILTVAAPPTRAAQTRTSTVPIVLYGGQDAVVEGFAETLARPGRNVTGVVIMSVQLESKRLQLLHEAVPGIRRVAALLYGGDEPLRARQTEELQRTAAALGLELQILAVRTPDDFAPAFAAMVASGAEALLIGANARLFSYRRELLERALATRLPTVCEWGSMARHGTAACWAMGRIERRFTAMLRPSSPACSGVRCRRTCPSSSPPCSPSPLICEPPGRSALSCRQPSSPALTR